VDTYAPLLADRISRLERRAAEDAIRHMFQSYRAFLEQYAALMLQPDSSREALMPKVLAAASAEPYKAERCFTKALALCSDCRAEADAVASAVRSKMPPSPQP
jgi:hypothetical protein